MPLRLGIASQTPYVRMKVAPEAVAGLGDPLPLRRLRRGVDFSVTPGGVARMIAGLVEGGPDLAGIWCTLSNGFPRDLELGAFRLVGEALDESSKRAYAHAKEIVWEAINGMPPRVARPAADASLLEGYAHWSRANARRLAAAHAEEPFDAVYTNDWQLLPQGRMLARVPRVMHFHAPFAEWTPPGWRDLLLADLAGFDAVVVSTRRWARALAGAGLRRRVVHVYPWLDPADHRPPSPAAARAFERLAALAPDDRVVLNVGRMDPVKGQEVLLRAFARVVRRHPAARLVLVGNGSFSSSRRGGIGLGKGAKRRAALEALARRLDVADRTVFTGHLPHEVVLAALARADVFALPSVGEGFGLAAVEAWLAGKPVVVSDGTGVAELVGQGGGVVFPSGDDAACAAALDRLLAAPEEAARLGAAGREIARATCHVRDRAPEVVAVLEAAAEGRRVAAEVGP